MNTSSYTSEINEIPKLNIPPNIKELPSSAAKVQKTSGKGYEFFCNVNISPKMKAVKEIAKYKPITDLNF